MEKNVSRDIEYYRLSDVSFRHEGTLRIPNTLGDLTKRENRFAHRVGFAATLPSWPYIMDQNVIRLFPFDVNNPPARVGDGASPLRPFGSPFQPDPVESYLTYLPDRLGEDVMLNNVLAWDLRVFDPGAPLVGTPLAGSWSGSSWRPL